MRHLTLGAARSLASLRSQCRAFCPPDGCVFGGTSRIDMHTSLGRTANPPSTLRYLRYPATSPNSHIATGRQSRLEQKRRTPPVSEQAIAASDSQLGRVANRACEPWYESLHEVTTGGLGDNSETRGFGDNVGRGRPLGRRVDAFSLLVASSATGARAHRRRREPGLLLAPRSGLAFGHGGRSPFCRLLVVAVGRVAPLLVR